MGAKRKWWFDFIFLGMFQFFLNIFVFYQLGSTKYRNWIVFSLSYIFQNVPTSVKFPHPLQLKRVFVFMHIFEGFFWYICLSIKEVTFFHWHSIDKNSGVLLYTAVLWWQWQYFRYSWEEMHINHLLYARTR